MVSNGEQCDEGMTNGAGYGHCAHGLPLGPRCGDGVTQAASGEQCDNGINAGASADKCKADCTLECGDGVVQPGRAVRPGRGTNVGGYNGCNADCTLGPRCGDGAEQAAQSSATTAADNGSYGTWQRELQFAGYCGDGAVQNPPESCDMGAANSVSAYGLGMCTNACKPAPYCSDHAVSGQFAETCDDGVNSGLPGSCTPDCKQFGLLVTCGNGADQPARAVRRRR